MATGSQQADQMYQAWLQGKGPKPPWVQEQQTGGVSNGNVPQGFVNSSVIPQGAQGSAMQSGQTLGGTSTATHNPYSTGTDYADQTAWGGHYLGGAQAYDRSLSLGAGAANAGLGAADNLNTIGAHQQDYQRMQMQNAAGGYQQQQQALGLAAQTAQGQGPAQQAAAAQLQQGTDAAIHAEQSMANSARGANGLANAQYQAAQQGGQALQTSANQAAQTRAQMAMQGQQNYMQGAQGMTGQALQAGLGYGQMGLGAGTAGAQSQMAGLGLQQAYENTGNAVNTSAVNASLGKAGMQQQQNQFNTQQNNQMVGTAFSAAGGVAGLFASAGGNQNNQNQSSYSDAHLQEPSGPAHWVLREEPDFILAKNARTGDVRKVATERLSPAEERQARAPHGADATMGRVYSDMVPGATQGDPNTPPQNTLSLGAGPRMAMSPQQQQAAQQEADKQRRAQMLMGIGQAAAKPLENAPQLQTPQQALAASGYHADLHLGRGNRTYSDAPLGDPTASHPQFYEATRQAFADQRPPAPAPASPPPPADPWAPQTPVPQAKPDVWGPPSTGNGNPWWWEPYRNLPRGDRNELGEAMLARDNPELWKQLQEYAAKQKANK